MNETPALPLEDFIQAITSQLDRTQMTMALKAKAGLPLTFAVKDMSLDLRAHLDMQGGAVTIRPAGPGEGDASTLHLELTTITKPMIEENTRNIAAAEDAPTIRDVLGDDLSDEDERRLEWVGIQDVAQFRELERRGGNRIVEKVVPRPIDQLRLALKAASSPRIDTIEAVRPAVPVHGQEGRPMPPQLLLRGVNLHGTRGVPVARIAGERVPVVEVGAERLLVQPLSQGSNDTIEIETNDGVAAIAFAGGDPDEVAATPDPPQQDGP